MATTAIRESEPKARRMSLFQPELYRNFAIGFAAGAVLVAVQIGSAGWSHILPASLAAILIR